MHLSNGPRGASEAILTAPFYVLLCLSFINAPAAQKASKWLEENLLSGMLSAYKAERALARSAHEVGNRGFAKDYLDKTIVTRQSEASSSRRKSLEEKARSNLFAITLCSSVVFSSISLAKEQQGLSFFAVLPIGYFALAAFASVRVLQVGKVATMSMDDERSSWRPQIEHWYLQFNNIDNTRKANWMWVSLTAMRNAILCLFIFALAALFYIPHAKLATAVPPLTQTSVK